MDHLQADKVKGLVHRTSLHLFAKYPQLRASHEFDDFEQSMWMEWLRVRDRYRPEMGYAFATYFRTCARNRTLKIIKARRLDLVTSTELVENVVEDEGTQIEDHVARGRVQARAFESVHPEMRKIAELLIADPEILRREARALAAKAALSSGAQSGAEPEITLPMLFKLMGLHRSQGYRLVAQFKETLDGYF